jgi:transposase InsO family protein
MHKHGFHPMKTLKAIFPGDIFTMDLVHMKTGSNVDGLPAAYVLAVIDVTTRFIFLEAVADATALTVARALVKIFNRNQYPQLLISDGGGEFNNDELEKILKDFGIKHHTTTPHVHKSNGLIETKVSKKQLKET